MSLKNMKKIPWWQPQIGKKEYELINIVLRSNFPNEGEMTEKFQRKISGLLGIKHAIFVSNCTSAIFLSLKALGIGYGDEVVVPDATFIATANAVEMSGAKAILADIDPKTFTLDINSFEKSITKKTKAVVPVHISGRAGNLEEIMKIAKKKRIFVIEDAAEAFMSKYKNRYLGTFGETGCFSFSPAKTITTGQGGMITTNNDRLYESLKELKNQGRRVRGTGGDDIHHSIGFNFRVTDLQAALGLGQLDYLKTRMQRMKKIYLQYRKHLDGIKEISLFRFNVDGGELPQWTDAIVEDRDKLDKFLQKNNIDSRRYWFPIHQQTPYKLPDTKFPNSTKLSHKALWLPSAYTLSDQDVITVCKYIKRFFKFVK